MSFSESCDKAIALLDQMEVDRKRGQEEMKELFAELQKHIDNAIGGLTELK